MPKNDSIRSCLPWEIMSYLRGSQFWNAVKNGFARSWTDVLHGKAISYPTKELNIIMLYNLELFLELALAHWRKHVKITNEDNS